MANQLSDAELEIMKIVWKNGAAVGTYRESFGAVTLSKNKQLLKERIGAIMNFKRKSKGVRVLTGVLTLCVILGASFIGVYSVSDAADRISDRRSAPETEEEGVFPVQMETDTYAARTEQYYEAGSLPLFEIAFSALDEEEKEEWLDRIYRDGQITFWGAVADQVDEDTLIGHFAEKAYEDDNIAFFSTLTMHMNEEALELWLDRALEDGSFAFQSVLFDALDREGEFDRLEEQKEKEWEETQLAEYRAAGITKEGKNYYYQGQLANIFLDIRQSGSFYVLDMNPAGTVNIRVNRGEDEKITDVSYMTDAEVEELFGDLDAPEDEIAPEAP